jgi:hypothetical protein
MTVFCQQMKNILEAAYQDAFAPATASIGMPAGQL